jgi:hypothetical protein
MPQRPTIVLVVAILHFILGGMGLISNAAMIFLHTQGGMPWVFEKLAGSMPAGSKERKEMEQRAKAGQMREEFLNKEIEYRPSLTIGIHVGSAAFDLLFIISGVMMLGLNPTGRSLSIVGALGIIVLVMGMMLFLFLVVGPAEDRVYKALAEKDKELAQAASEMNEAGPMAIVGGVIGLIYPVFVLGALTRPHVAAAFRGEAWGPDREDDEMGYGEGRGRADRERHEEDDRNRPGGEDEWRRT